MAGRTRKPAAPTPAARGVEVVYSVAVSLDGFIAADDGGVDWLHGAMVKGESYGLPEFMNSIDGLLMGQQDLRNHPADGRGDGFVQTVLGLLAASARVGEEGPAHHGRSPERHRRGVA